jgi:AcrR family transcriptional regulator
VSRTSPRPAIPATPARSSRPPKDEVRTRVLRAAGEVFAERGFAAASLDQVAAAAGFTKGAVYSNFASKDELFLALMAEEVQRRVDGVTAALQAATDLPAALAAVNAELSRREAAWQLLFLEFWQRAVRDPEVRRRFVASRRDLRTRIAATVARYLTEHPVHTGWDAESLTLVIIALANGLAVEALPDPEAVPDDLLARVLADLVAPERP